MEQKSNVQRRAEKEYKNSREKFFLLLREVISNALHSILIRKSKEKDNSYKPKLYINIENKDSSCKITIRDNGEGFTEENQRCFEELDRVNLTKDKMGFHPLGQGRLALIYFADSARYETEYKDGSGDIKHRSIPYPDTESELFDFKSFSEDNGSTGDTYTELKICINSNSRISRAQTFFKSHPTIESLEKWFIETFFPFIITNDELEVTLIYNGDKTVIKKTSLKENSSSISFSVTLNKPYDFHLYLIKKSGEMHGENHIKCFARNLTADLSNGKLSYFIDNNENYLLYLISDFFDNNINTKGDKIEISLEDIASINEELTKELDEYFKDVIKQNKNTSQSNYKKFGEKYPSLEVFLNKDDYSQNKGIIYIDDFVKKAVEEKGNIEKKFWRNIDNEEFKYSEDCDKLLNSSLHIYIKHREKVLQELHKLIQKFGPEGDYKPELESKVQELILRRGTTLETDTNINHLHNLWILDDKFTTFSPEFKAISTKPGEALSDIYLWADDPEKTKQVLILELKSTTHAHNAGDKHEGMVAQVKRYAQNFYKNPTSTLNWDVKTDQVIYTGIILARKKDIDKELTSNNVGNYHPIPFLESSFYIDGTFTYDGNPRHSQGIRIELYSFEDIYSLASDRNQVFFNLLKTEFEITNETE